MNINEGHSQVCAAEPICCDMEYPGERDDLKLRDIISMLLGPQSDRDVTILACTDFHTNNAFYAWWNCPL